MLEYVVEKNVGAAKEILKAFGKAIAYLPDHPYLYRSGRISGTREIVVNSTYLIIDRIEIVNVLHARQEYPRRDSL